MRPDKRLGQHFLRDADVLEDIASVADVAHSAGALEIGPGEGALTAYLADAGRPIVAVDRDPRAVRELARRFGERVQAMEGDALAVDLEALLPTPGEDGRLPVIVGNLPYNAASAIFRRLLGLQRPVARMVLMFQREVARRIVAGPGSRAYGVPSVLRALVADAWIVRDVPPEAFFPRPKVDSAVVLVEPRSTPAFPGADGAIARQDAFGTFLSRVFQARRKVLANAVKPAQAVTAAGLDPRGRAEGLTPEELWRLFRATEQAGAAPERR